MKTINLTESEEEFLVHVLKDFEENNNSYIKESPLTIGKLRMLWKKVNGKDIDYSLYCDQEESYPVFKP